MCFHFGNVSAIHLKKTSVHYQSMFLVYISSNLSGWPNTLNSIKASFNLENFKPACSVSLGSCMLYDIHQHPKRGYKVAHCCLYNDAVDGKNPAPVDSSLSHYGFVHPRSFHYPPGNDHISHLGKRKIIFTSACFWGDICLPVVPSSGYFWRFDSSPRISKASLQIMAVTKFNKTLVCHVAGFLFLEETAANLVLIYPGYHPVGQTYPKNGAHGSKYSAPEISIPSSKIQKNTAKTLVVFGKLWNFCSWRGLLQTKTWRDLSSSSHDSWHTLPSMNVCMATYRLVSYHRFWLEIVCMEANKLPTW